MTARRARSRPRSSSSRVALAIGNAAAAACLAGLPLAAALPAAAGATPSQATPTVDIAASAQRSIGVVRIREREKSSTGWIAGDGLVVTSDIVAKETGTAVSFTVGSDDAVACYAAAVEPARHLAYLRCADLDGPALAVAKMYPAPGTPLTAFVASMAGQGVAVTSETGAVTANDVPFMKANRLQFSIAAAPGDSPANDGRLDADEAIGAPLLDAEGRVVSTILTAPDDGGLPLGTSPSELAKGVKEASTLPATISSAAVLTVARRSVVPAVAGLVLGLVWALVARSGNILAKTLGLGTLGVVGAVGYTLFTLLVVGPEALIG